MSPDHEIDGKTIDFGMPMDSKDEKLEEKKHAQRQTKVKQTASEAIRKQPPCSRKLGKRNQHEAKATGGVESKAGEEEPAAGKSNGRQRDATAVEPKGRQQGPILKKKARTPNSSKALFGKLISREFSWIFVGNS